VDGRANADDGHDRGQEESASFEACIIAWIVMHRQIEASFEACIIAWIVMHRQIEALFRFHGKTLVMYF